VTGPMAAQVAGRIYRRLDSENYFVDKSTTKSNLSANTGAAR
jgi:hypothetical protein